MGGGGGAGGIKKSSHLWATQVTPAVGPPPPPPPPPPVEPWNVVTSTNVVTPTDVEKLQKSDNHKCSKTSPKNVVLLSLWFYYIWGLCSPPPPPPHFAPLRPNPRSHYWSDDTVRNRTYTDQTPLLLLELSPKVSVPAKMSPTLISIAQYSSWY